MQRPTDPVKRVCYADNLTVWASGVNIPDLEVSLNNYLEEITAYLKYNSLLISGPKSSVTLLTLDTHQAKTHPSILIEDSRLPLVKNEFSLHRFCLNMKVGHLFVLRCCDFDW